MLGSLGSEYCDVVFVVLASFVVHSYFHFWFVFLLLVSGNLMSEWYGMVLLCWHVLMFLLIFFFTFLFFFRCLVVWCRSGVVWCGFCFVGMFLFLLSFLLLFLFQVSGALVSEWSSAVCCLYCVGIFFICSYFLLFFFFFIYSLSVI